MVLNILSGIQFYFEPMDVDGMITCCFFFIAVVLFAQQKAQGLFSVVWKGIIAPLVDTINLRLIQKSS
jgi:hypothetical protein